MWARREIGMLNHFLSGPIHQVRILGAGLAKSGDGSGAGGGEEASHPGATPCTLDTCWLFECSSSVFTAAVRCSGAGSENGTCLSIP